MKTAWTILCKTPDCRTLCVLQLARENLPTQFIPASIPQEFDYQCGQCGKIHHYRRSDVELKSIPPSVQ